MSTSCAVTFNFQRYSAMQSLRLVTIYHAESVSKPGACVVCVFFSMQNLLTCGKFVNTLCNEREIIK